MQNIITSVSGLKAAIQLLEAEQVVNRQLLKDQLYITCESLNPLNILKNTLNKAVTSPNLIDNVLGATIGLATGYLSRKIVVGVSGNLFKKLFGSVIQMGVTNIVAQHPNDIKSFGQFIFQHIFSKKEMNDKSSDNK